MSAVSGTSFLGTAKWPLTLEHWSRTYCILSCGGAPLSIIKQYIEQQAAPI
jgi:REP element-mobilizing transposase RayT